MPKIKLTTPDGVPYEFEITADRARIGRAEDNDFVVPDGSVSSRHGEIVLTDGGIEIVDLGSTNGTHVGGQRVERANVAPGGTFRLGNVEGVLVGDEGAAEESSESAYDEESAPVTGGGWSGGGASNTAVITGLGATSCPTGRRQGFGPKTKQKGGAAGIMIALAVVAILVCAGAAFMISQMGA